MNFTDTFKSLASFARGGLAASQDHLLKNLKVFRIREVLPGITPILIASLDSGVQLDFFKLIFLILGFLSIFFSSFLINELVDANDTDKFNPEREKGITRHGVSKNFTLAAFFLTSILGILILNSLGLLLPALIGFILLLIYSAPPIRLKSRPFLDLIAVTIGFVFLPYLSYFYLTGISPNVLVLFFFAFGFMAIDLVAEGADYAADKQANILTTAVFLGEKRNLILISALSLSSILLGIYTVIITGRWWYFYMIGLTFFLFTAARFGLTIYRDHNRLHELLRTGERFGIYVSDLGVIIILIIFACKNVWPF